jgi:hypothetical protein
MLAFATKEKKKEKKKKKKKGKNLIGAAYVEPLPIPDCQGNDARLRST